MPLYIAKSGDLDRCYRCLTHSLTTLKDSATQLLIKYKSGALVTQFIYRAPGKRQEARGIQTLLGFRSSENPSLESESLLLNTC